MPGRIGKPGKCPRKCTSAGGTRSRQVTPEALTLELRRDETGLHFRYFDAQRTYSSGKILFDK